MGPNKAQRELTDFDLATVGNNTKLLKILIPFLAPEEQKMFGLMIRMMEFNMTLDYYKRNLSSLTQKKTTDVYDFLKELGNYLSKEERENIDLIINMMKMKKVKETKDITGMMDSFMSNEQYDKFKQYEDLL